MKDKPYQLRRLSIRWSSSSDDMLRDGIRLKLRIATQSFCDTFIFIVQDRWQRSQ
jgi:hypothetical protein